MEEMKLCRSMVQTPRNESKMSNRLLRWVTAMSRGHRTPPLLLRNETAKSRMVEPFTFPQTTHPHWRDRPKTGDTLYEPRTEICISSKRRTNRDTRIEEIGGQLVPFILRNLHAFKGLVSRVVFYIRYTEAALDEAACLITIAFPDTSGPFCMLSCAIARLIYYS